MHIVFVNLRKARLSSTEFAYSQLPAYPLYQVAGKCFKYRYLKESEIHQYAPSVSAYVAIIEIILIYHVAGKTIPLRGGPLDKCVFGNVASEMVLLQLCTVISFCLQSIFSEEFSVATSPLMRYTVVNLADIRRFSSDSHCSDEIMHAVVVITGISGCIFSNLLTLFYVCGSHTDANWVVLESYKLFV